MLDTAVLGVDGNATAAGAPVGGERLHRRQTQGLTAPHLPSTRWLRRAASWPVTKPVRLEHSTKVVRTQRVVAHPGIVDPVVGEQLAKRPVHHRK
jgi:hypothetical protein